MNSQKMPNSLSTASDYTTIKHKTQHIFHFLKDESWTARWAQTHLFARLRLRAYFRPYLLQIKDIFSSGISRIYWHKTALLIRLPIWEVTGTSLLCCFCHKLSELNTVQHWCRCKITSLTIANRDTGISIYTYLKCLGTDNCFSIKFSNAKREIGKIWK